MGQVLLNVPYETSVSDPDSYAGARVIRMILDFLKNAYGGPTPPSVDNLYTHAQANNDPGEMWPGWYLDPQGVRNTLTDYDPRGPGHWVYYTNPGQPAADDQARGTIDTFQVPEGNLVYGGKHWVCLVGYTFDDGTKKTTGFIINDPAYAGGGANLAVSLAQWDMAYTPVGGGVRWLNQITEVGDPRPVEPGPGPAPRLIRATGESIIPPEEAAKLAVEGALQQFGELPNLREALRHGRVGEPKLVARLDLRGGYYYAIPIEAESKEGPGAIGAIMLDARLGDVLSASAAAEPFQLWPITHDHVREIVTRSPIPVYHPVETVAGQLLDAINPCGQPALPQRRSARETLMAGLTAFATPRDYLVLRGGDFEIEPIWYWIPCGGVSPFHPYYRVRTAWRNFYVNARTGVIPAEFDWCFWRPLGA